MTAPLPIDISGIDQPLPDPGHEALRVAVLNAIEQVWVLHLQLVAQVNSLQQQVNAMPFTTVLGQPATVAVSPQPGTVTQ